MSHTLPRKPRMLSPLLLAAALGLLGRTLGAQLPEPASGRVVFGDSAFLPGVSAAVLATDLNADGYSDIVTGTFGVLVGLNNGAGVFTLVANTEVDDPHYRRLLGADFDDDGFQDVIASSTANGGRAWIFRGDGTGHLSLAGQRGVRAASDIAVADINLDGALDLVASHEDVGRDFHLLLGGGDGTLGLPTPFGDSGHCDFIAAGDWNLDGAPDVFCDRGSDIDYWVNDGSGDLSEQFADFDENSISGPIRFVDLEGDGIPELLHRRWSPFEALVIQRNDAGGFGDSTVHAFTTSLGSDIEDIAVESTPSDGLRDFAVAGGTRIDVFDHTALGIDKLPSVVADFGLAQNSLVSVGDVDGDGNMDLVHLADKGARVRFRQTYDSFGTTLLSDLDDGPGGLKSPGVLLAAQLDADPEPEFLLADDATALCHVLEVDENLLLHVVKSFPTHNGSPRHLLLADIVEDGHPDLVLAHSGPTAIGFAAVHPSDGLGDFGAPLVTQIGGNILDVVDVNADGHLDLASLSGASNPGFALSTWFGAGDASFVAGPESPLADHFRGARIGDMNGDGIPDAVSVHQGSGASQVSVQLGDGAGGYGPAILATNPDNATHEPELGDFDGNGTLDVVTPTFSDGGRVALFLNDGSGQLSHATRAGFATSVPRTLVVTDIDQDGWLDVAHSTAGDRMLVVLRGDGAGGFESPTAHAGAWSTLRNTLVCVDVDADGRRDLVQVEASDTNSELLVLRSQGSPIEAWASAGGGVPGASGQPRAKGSGRPKAGKTIRLQVTRAPASNASFIVLGVGLLGSAYKGGHLVPTPDFIVPGPPTNAAGELSFSFAWTTGLPEGVDLWLQLWFPDASAALGFSAAGGHRLRIP
ncbi:MAG: hypothetical protein DHS20C15_16190 [Planctomycetota bacterium]|nr:MAG: hypothetical protein DHS20C15_16190 [Planctomycetota bacterium]